MFAAFYAYSHLGTSLLSTAIYIFLLFLGSVLVYPFLNMKKPLYTFNDEGIRQNKFYFLPRKILWDGIKSVSYPASSLLGGKDAVTLRKGSFNFFTISLSDIENPLELIEALDHYRPFGLNQLQTSEYLKSHFDREKIFYTTLLFLCIGIAVLLYASFYMPYITLEDHRYSYFWGLLFLLQLFFSIAVSFIVYKNIGARKLFLKITLIFWLFIFIVPFIIERNIYYNMKAMMAEKKKDYSIAERYIRKAIELHPGGYSYYETLGKTLYGLGKYNESIDQFIFLLRNNRRLTDYYKAYYHLWIGKSFLKLDKVNEAGIEFQIVKEYNIDKFNKEIDSLEKNKI